MIIHTFGLKKITNGLRRTEKKLIHIFCVFIFFSVLMFGIVLLTMEKHIDKELKGNVDFLTLTKISNHYITRPNGRGDGGVVRVMFAVVSTRINWMLCYAVASAYFTNIPIVVIGYEKQNYNNVYKPEMFIHAVEQAGLQDSDVVLALDSDIMFTGLDYLPFIDKFIKQSPANLNELDAKAIRTGKAMAPSIYSAEKNCFAPQTLPPQGARCHTAYEQVYQKHNEYVKHVKQSELEPFVNYDGNSIQHLNSGTSIHRVWAMRKLFGAFHKFMYTNIPLDNKEWWEDQSVLAKLYLELRLWEIEQDYFRKRTEELRTMSNEYGLYAGLMGLDFTSEISSLVPPNLEQDFWLSTEFWQVNNSKIASKQKLFDYSTKEYLQKLYNLINVTEVFTERKLARSYSNVHNLTIAPPLLSVVSKHINGKDEPAERVFPWLLHFAGLQKEKRWPKTVNYMQWYVPMMFDKEEWKRGNEYTMSMPIELWTDTNEKLRLRYGDVCAKHPFKLK